MTGTPWSLAFLMTVAADGLSRLTITRTLAPPLSIWSAMVANFALSPLAFWMSYSTPADLKASVRNGRSAPSQRAEEAVSGRITPTLPLGLSLLLDDFLLLLLELSLSSPPQAATVKAITSTAMRAR